LTKKIWKKGSVTGRLTRTLVSECRQKWKGSTNGGGKKDDQVLGYKTRENWGNRFWRGTWLVILIGGCKLPKLRENLMG